ncbi:DUF1203 domain-containing protein [Prauserella muralis]|uniref:Uncharacterized protein n=1 Tax=Prauserella muralis TaxID=588067 RepID=A0A2V4B9H3_9PSEU|nr:DUF1203 domain-containing protein [Prauserella muralis]PXY31927.1 hypothetical protein BAY60_06260 [Prauserella muralis]TWE13650.1 uncharacterized protein DUF1203 [Prauserella muralis]
MTFRIAPLDEALAKEVRTTLRSPGYGHPAWTDVPSSPAPCRVCLHPILPGEERLIGFTYDAFSGLEDLPLPGPVFVHERDCTPYRDTARFPPLLGNSGVVLDAYRRGRRLLIERRAAKPEIETALGELLGRPEVDYVHVRSATAGCYLCTALPAQSR